MKADEIRAEAVRRVLNELQNVCRHSGEWDDELDACPDCHHLATAAVDALGDLLPTHVELKCGWIHRDIDNTIIHREPARRCYATDWRPVEGTETA